MNEEELQEQGILREYIKDLEEKLRETKENLEKQTRINIRITTSYEYLDEEYDKIYSLLTEEQKKRLND